MKSIAYLLAIFAVSSAQDLNLNELCRGTLFGTLPHPADRNQFIGCVQGKGTIFNCYNVEDVFDPIRVSCVDKDSLPTIPTPPVDEICAGIDFGLLPVEDDCELHVLCDSGRATVRRCPANSVFNPNVQSCVPGDLESCADFEITTEHPTEQPVDTTTEDLTTWTDEWTTWNEETTMPDETTTLLTTQSPTNPPSSTPGSVTIPVFRCNPDGSGNIPNVDNCGRYFQCITGIRNPRTCDEGLIFDIIKRECGPPETSLCATYVTCG